MVTKNSDILVVDDSALVRQIMQSALDCFKIFAADDGRKAVELANQREFVLVLLDLQMPVMDGFETLAAIRGSKLNTETPVIAVTASSSLADRMACITAGFDDCLSKPFKPEQLVRKVRMHVACAEAIRAAMEGAEVNSLHTDECFQKTIRNFIIEVRVLTIQIENALWAGDFDTIARCLHKIKGNGSMAGFPVYTHLARRIESDLESGRTSALPEHVERLKNIVAHTNY